MGILVWDPDPFQNEKQVSFSLVLVQQKFLVEKEEKYQLVSTESRVWQSLTFLVIK